MHTPSATEAGVGLLRRRSLGWRPRPGTIGPATGYGRRCVPACGPPPDRAGTFASIGNTGTVITWKVHRGGCAGSGGLGSRTRSAYPGGRYGFGFVHGVVAAVVPGTVGASMA